MKKVCLITVGDELITGFTADTNAAYMARRFFETGFSVVGILTVGDDRDAVKSALNTATGAADIVVVTGGLGPTHDDITKEAAAEFFSRKLSFNQAVWNDLLLRFSRKGKTLSGANRCQAEVPERAEVLPNRIGTAPGLRISDGAGEVYLLPGVPSEMICLLDEEILPRLRRTAPCRPPQVLTLKTFGIPESLLYSRVKDFEELFPDIRLAFLPGEYGVDIRLRTVLTGTGPQAGSPRIDRGAVFLKQRLGTAVYGQDDDTMEETVSRLLQDRQLTIATAESCTGGLIGHLLTNIPGSSAWFTRGYIVYSNEAKRDDLGVPAAVLETHGAVSSQTAACLAAGVRKRAGADIGISVTGIAGPGGGSPEKPVGLVHVGYADHTHQDAEQHQFFNDRRLNKCRFAAAALDFARRKLDLS